MSFPSIPGISIRCLAQSGWLGIIAARCAKVFALTMLSAAGVPTGWRNRPDLVRELSLVLDNLLRWKPRRVSETRSTTVRFTNGKHTPVLKTFSTTPSPGPINPKSLQHMGLRKSNP